MPLQEGGCLLHGDPHAKEHGSSVGLRFGGPQLSHERETLASFRWKMGPSGFGWVHVLGREGSRGSLTSSFHQRQVLACLLLRNHVPVTRGLRCLNKGLGDS